MMRNINKAVWWCTISALIIVPLFTGISNDKHIPDKVNAKE